MYCTSLIFFVVSFQYLFQVLSPVLSGAARWTGRNQKKTPADRRRSSCLWALPKCGRAECSPLALVAAEDGRVEKQKNPEPAGPRWLKYMVCLKNILELMKTSEYLSMSTVIIVFAMEAIQNVPKPSNPRWDTLQGLPSIVAVCNSMWQFVFEGSALFFFSCSDSWGSFATCLSSCPNAITDKGGEHLNVFFHTLFVVFDCMPI